MSKTFQNVPPCSYNKPQVARGSGEYGLKTKLMVIFLVILVTSHSLPRVFGASDSPYSQNDQHSVISNLREAAESRRDELLYLFEEEVPSEILSQLQGAIEKMNTASSLENEDQYMAAQAYLEALKLFRESWESYSDYKPEAGEESLVTVVEDLTQEPEPQDIEEAIKDNKEKRIIKFQEKILKNIEEDEDSDAVSSVFETVKSGLENLKQMIKEGSLTSAVEVLKISASQYKTGVDEITSKQSSKLDKSLTHIESKLEKEVEKTNNGNNFTPEEDEKEKTNNGNDKEKTNNGNSDPVTVESSNNNGNGNGNSDEDTQSASNEDKSNNSNGNGNSKSEEESNSESNSEEKSNNGNGNDKDSTDTDSTEEPESEEKTNNGNGNEKTGTETSESSSNDKDSDESQDKDKSKSNNSSKKDEKEKSNKGKTK